MTDDSRQPERQPVPGPQFLDTSEPADRVAAPRTESWVPSGGHGDDHARVGIRLGLTAFIVATTIAGVLIIGGVGHQLGLDHWLGIGARGQSLTSVFVDGARIPASLLRSIYDTGVNDPLFFAIAMLVLIPAIAGLAAARPNREGDAPVSGPVRVVGLLTAGIVIIVDVIVMVRLLAADRPDFTAALESDAWLQTLEGLAASDGVTTVLAILLAVLAFRLPVDKWARVLAGTIALATALAALAAASASASIVDGVSRDFPMVRSADGATTTLLLGQLTTGGTIHLGLQSPHSLSISYGTGEMEIVGRQSIAETCSRQD